jgi:predicted metal-binding membrane protein
MEGLATDDGRDDASGRGARGIPHVRAGARLSAVPGFVASYLAVWTVVGVAVYTLYSPPGAVAAGAVVVAAGAYELTPLKTRCRQRCQQPPVTGLRFGIWCLGSTAGLMAVLLALGGMSVLWMSVVSAAVLAHKSVAPRRYLDVAFSLALIGLGVALAVALGHIPGLMPAM